MKKYCYLLVLLLSAVCVKSASNDDIYKALDSPAGVTVVGQEFIQYYVDGEYGDIAEDDDGNPIIYKTSTESKWKIVNGSSTFLLPADSNTCVGSAFSESNAVDIANSDKKRHYYAFKNDAVEARLKLRVTGPGTFSFYALSSCEHRDGLSVYVDGEEESMWISGYPDADWDLDKEQYTSPGFSWDADETLYEISIGNPVTDDDGNVISYDHEIVFVFTKDEPDIEATYNSSGNITGIKTFRSDGPDVEIEDCDAECQEERSVSKRTFKNCVWIDKVTWTPTPVTLGWYGDKDKVYDDKQSFLLSHNLDDFGYHIRYTLDGSAPTSASPVYSDEEGIEADKDCTVKAAVFAGSTANPVKYSPATEVTFDLKFKASAPVIAVDEAATLEKLVVAISNKYDGNTILYSLDGSVPGVAYTTPLEPKESLTIKARCVREGAAPSDVVEFPVVKLPVPTVKVEDLYQYSEPNFLYQSGEELRIGFSSSDAEARIKYSRNGAPLADYSGIISDYAPCTYRVQVFKQGCIPGEPVDVNIREIDMADVTFGDSPASAVAISNGWNLVSFPMIMTSNSMNNLLGRWNVLGLDGAAYTKASAIEPGKAYWMYKAKDNSFYIKLSGGSLSAPAVLKPGWNMTDALSAGAAFKQGASIWMYKDDSFHLVENAGEISDWCGYWVFVQ